jgi:hypothetical protein
MTNEQIDAMPAGMEMNIAIDKYVIKSPAGSYILNYSTDIAADYSVHQAACKFIFSKRLRYLNALDEIWQNRAHSQGLEDYLKVSYPDILRFYEVGDYSRAALKAVAG